MPSRGSMMERLRADLLRRARSERNGDVEQGISDTTPPATTTQPAMAEARDTTTAPRFGLLPLQLPALPHFLGGGRSRAARSTEAEMESPKSPEFVSQRPPTLPPMHLEFSSLADSFGPNSNVRRTPPVGHPSLIAPSSVYSQDSHHPGEHPARPEPTVTARSASAGSGRSASLDTPDPAEAELARLGIEGRRRQERRQRRREEAERTGSAGSGSGRSTSERSRKKPPPTRFLFCFPWVKSRRMRSQILRCFVSGIFLLILLAVYLALSLTKSMNSGEFTIVLILVVLCATVFFCHALLRLFILIFRGDKPTRRRLDRNTHYLSPAGYAVPEEPIPVVLAQDEEARGAPESEARGAPESEASKVTPPAYGLWRGSVRVDPNRLFWQRNEDQAAGARPETRTGPRPPSYASDDGVSYVMEAAPRSTAPTTDVPLPPHPSEAGRVPGNATW